MRGVNYISLRSRRLSHIGHAMFGNAGGARTSSSREGERRKLSRVSSSRSRRLRFLTSCAVRPIYTQAPATQGAVDKLLFLSC